MTAPLDLAGIGVGPFNLSIAALLASHRQPGINSAFFDAKPQFDWHPGMLLPGVRLQTSFLKDLVTGVAPQSPYSFLQFLVSHGRFYQFLAAELPAISRAEYGQYLAWVAGQLDNLHFGQELAALDFDGRHFQLHFKAGGPPVAARNICLGTGKPPHIPPCCQPFLGDNCFHAIGIARRQLDVRGKRVVVLGGGQSGAEVFEALLDGHWGQAKALHWVSRRSNFAPLDETPFANEVFTPQYMAAFFDLPDATKARTLADQKLASDGISPDSLKALYQKLYEGKVLGQLPPLSLRPGRHLQAMHQGQGYRLVLENQLDGKTEELEADLVILATGFNQALPAYLAPLQHKLVLDAQGQLSLDRHFQARWTGPEANRIYAVNAGRFSHGIAEPQMSLMCWRSASIINHLAGQPLFATDQKLDLVNWRQDGPDPLALAV